METYKLREGPLLQSLSISRSPAPQLVRRKICARGIVAILVAGLSLFSPPSSEAKQPEQMAPTTELSQEAYYGRTEQLATLIASGGDVNDQLEAGRVLIWAALGAEPECASLLIEAGADFNFQEGDGLTALMYATGFFRKNLPQKGSWNEEATTRTLILLLESGAEVNSRSKAGDTALIYAACTGSLERIVLLLDWGADVNAACDDGYTPLILACEWIDEAAGAASS